MLVNYQLSVDLNRTLFTALEHILTNNKLVGLGRWFYVILGMLCRTVGCYPLRFSLILSFAWVAWLMNRDVDQQGIVKPDMSQENSIPICVNELHPPRSSYALMQGLPERKCWTIFSCREQSMSSKRQTHIAYPWKCRSWPSNPVR